MTASFVLIAVGLCLALIYMIKHVYIFQIKEYRFDRIRARIEDLGILHYLFMPDIQTPSKRHPRNIAILAWGMLMITALSLVIHDTLPMGIALIILSPLLALTATTSGVVLTSIPVWIYRQRTMRRAQQIIRYVNPIVIGVTGSYGKSITKDYLHHVLSPRYTTAKTDHNQNTDIGIALSTIRNVHKGTQYFVVEMGAYRQGEIASAVALARPTYAILTAIGTQHISLFGGQENLFRAKCEIARTLPPDGLLCIASDIDRMLKLRLEKLCPCPIIEYQSVPHDPHATAVNAAVTLATRLGVPEDVLDQAVKTIPKPRSITLHTHPAGYIYLDCSYSSGVEAFISHLHLLRSARKHTKLVLTSGIIELGRHRAQAYQRILSEMPPHTRVFTTDRSFAHEARSSRKSSLVHYDSHAARLMSAIEPLLTSDSAILIEGKFRKDYVDRIILS